MERQDEINRTDIIENIMFHDYARRKHFIKSEYDIKIVRKIISLYLHFMVEALFRGKNWMLPAKLGRISIKKNTYKDVNRIPFFQKHLKNKDAKNKRVMNPKTPGVVYKIEMISAFMERHKCRFRPSKKIRDRLFNELYHGELSKTIK